MNFFDYQGIYVVAIPKNGQLVKVSAELIGQAQKLASQLGEKVAAVIAGHHLEDMAQELIYLGADMVYTIDSPILSHYDGVAYQKALGQFFKEKKPNVVLFGADSYGRDLAPRLAGELVCGVTADVTGLSIDEETKLIVWTRPAMGGNIMADIISPDYRPQMGTVRPGIFHAPKKDLSRKGSIIPVTISLDMNDLGTILKEVLRAEDDCPLENAELILAGGRGFHTKEEWAQLHELAHLMGAAVGCSRPMSVMGFEPFTHQIGQTGKGVSPKVYMALGISGAMQHMCAVKPDILIAVNKDPEAPIMKLADYAIVADLRKFIPMFIEKLKALKEKE